MNCPECQSNNFQRVSVVYNTQMRINNKGYDGSLLAYELEPPQFKKSQLFLATALMLSVLSILIAIAISKVDFLIKFANLGYLTIAFMVLVTIACLSKIYTNYAYNTNKHPQEYHEWSKQWFCHCCGSKFVGYIAGNQFTFTKIDVM